MRYRVFQARFSKQVSSDGIRRPFAWHYEPVDYTGDVLWSSPFATQQEAKAAAEADFGDEVAEVQS